MKIDVDAIAHKREAASAFTRCFLTAYLTPAFGTRSKTEIDLLVFSSLIEAKVIDVDSPIYEIARALNIPTTRARTLLHNWQLRAPQSASDLQSAIVASLKKTRFSADGSLMTFGVESPLVKEEIVARLRRAGVFADASFSKEIIRMPIDAFVDFLDTLLDAETKKNVKAILIKDGQLPDRSFKALATGILRKLGEKVAGEAGGALSKGVVDRVGSFLGGMLSSDPKAATKGISVIDFIEA